MSGYVLESLLSQEELKSELRNRSKQYFEASIAKKEYPLHAQNGWYIVRENKNTFRVRLDKDSQEKLEDEFWVLLTKLGFNELNSGRTCTINAKNFTHKLNVLAKDDETVVVAECIVSEKRKLGPAIKKIKGYREDVVKAIHEKYGREFKPKFGWLLVTRDITWSEKDLAAAHEADICPITDTDLDYFIELEKHIRTAARFQFLASVFQGKTIDELSLKVPATKGKMGGIPFFTFLISPEHLMKVAYIGHKSSSPVESLDTYQRMLKSRRLKDIAKYINEGGKFPTNIVVNLETKRKLQFNKKDEIGGLAFGELSLPNSYASAWVIDGQHRLYGYAFSERASDSVVPVLAFLNLSPEEQKELFVDINNKQVKVPRSLLLDIYSELHWGSMDPRQSLLSLSSKVVKVLGGTQSSPMYERVIIGEQKKTNHRCLTITTIADALIKEQLLGSVNATGDRIKPGIIGDENLENALKRSTTFLSLYFASFKKALSEQWELGDAKGGYICTNNAIVAQLKVLRAIFDVLKKEEKEDLHKLSVDNLYLKVKKYLDSLLEWLRGQPEDKFVSLRSKVGSKGQIAVGWEMQQEIFERNSNFLPTGLKEWMASFDKEGTKTAKISLDEIQLALFNFTLSSIKKKYGDESWWVDGIPETTRLKCVNRREREGRKYDEVRYLDLIDYRSIALDNWADCFHEYFSISDQKGNKEKQTKWLVELNEIRKKISHPEKGLLTKKEVEFIEGLKNELKVVLHDFWPR
ncbi:DGQHR domain-containing protein [Emcibacter sp.]|uniref:DGQHR domain-containing protein n=1 Tax=Emcibacter sp. TaxID=1979954 RepID=UPI003A8E603A